MTKTSPIAIYTSGKGSSAAGLTASVMKDPVTQTFVVEVLTLTCDYMIKVRILVRFLIKILKFMETEDIF